MRKLIFALAGILFAAMLAVALYMESVPALSPDAPEAHPDQSASRPEVQPTVRPTELPTEETEVPAETEEPVPAEPDYIQVEKLFQIVDGEVAYNGELQLYTATQVTIEEDVLEFRAELVDGEYLSGKVVSKTAFRYGTFVFRLETTQKPGFFPAIWMLPASGEAYPELDIYEAVGNDPNRAYGVLHRSALEEEKEILIGWVREEQISGTYELRFEWTPEQMTWFLDGQKIGSMTKNCPDIPMYMICNLAVGGNWAGRPLNSDFPETYRIQVLEFSPEEIFAR